MMRNEQTTRNDGTILERLGKALFIVRDLRMVYEAGRAQRTEIRRLLRSVIIEMGQGETLKALALEILDKYESAEDIVIQYHSGNIDKDTREVGEEIRAYREQIEKSQ